MSSLASIPEDGVLGPSDFQPSANSKKTNSKRGGSQSSSHRTRATNSNAQSSAGSQKMRATARSKLMEEAKREADGLLKLRPVFNDVVKLFSKKDRNNNEMIFVKWKILLDTVEECTTWKPKAKIYMNLRLQNPPGQDAMDYFNEYFDDFTMLVRQLQNDLPAPSDFGQSSVWPEAQKATPILCLRPPNARGLPLITLHDVFRRFQLEMSRPVPMTTETVAVQIAASKLCSKMGEAFKNEAERGEAFDECVNGVLDKGVAEHKLQPHPASHWGTVDRCILEANIPIALREDKVEFGHGKSDAYMQIARCYDLLVDVLTNNSVKDPNASNFLSHGAPCFLICLIGPMLFVCGGFYDGHKPVVEPLAKPVFMLTDHTRTRQAEVATLLGALARGISSLRRLVTEPSQISFAPSTPRVYDSCTLLEPEDEVGTLTFVSRLHDGYQRLFLATLTSPSIPGLQVLVKLVPRSYSREVHEYMAKNQLAPKLYGYAEVEGAPTAYVMEYLDLSIWQTLHPFFEPEKEPRVDLPQLREAVRNILQTLDNGDYVHGDLRTNNIMIRTDVIENSVELRVVDFDWAGKAGQVCYPAERNTDIQWPGKAGEAILKKHDSEMVNSWLPKVE